MILGREPAAESAAEKQTRASKAITSNPERTDMIFLFLLMYKDTTFLHDEDHFL